MVNTFKSLMQFNTIRFSAYRTSMKIRELQKKLSRKHHVDNRYSHGSRRYSMYCVWSMDTFISCGSVSILSETLFLYRPVRREAGNKYISGQAGRQQLFTSSQPHFALNWFPPTQASWGYIQIMGIRNILSLLVIK